MNKLLTVAIILMLNGCGMFSKTVEPQPTPMVVRVEVEQAIRASMCTVQGMIEHFNSGTLEDFQDMVVSRGTVSGEEFRILWGRAQVDLANANDQLTYLKQYYLNQGCEL